MYTQYSKKYDRLCNLVLGGIISFPLIFLSRDQGRSVCRIWHAFTLRILGRPTLAHLKKTSLCPPKLDLITAKVHLHPPEA